MKEIRLTLQQKLMLADAAKDGGKYQCVSREWQTGRTLARKGLGEMWHDMFTINSAGRNAIGL